MSNPGDGDATPITSVRQLAEYIAAGCKPRAQWRIGTEHEKFGFRLEDHRPPPYEPADGQPGCIRDLLRGLQRHGGTPILDHDNIIGLVQDDAAVSLEPAGQLELSGAPLETLHDTRAELDGAFRAGARRLARRCGWAGRCWASTRPPPAPRCRGCRKAATPSCAATCPRSVGSAST